MQPSSHRPRPLQPLQVYSAVSASRLAQRESYHRSQGFSAYQQRLQVKHPKQLRRLTTYLDNSRKHNLVEWHAVNLQRLSDRQEELVLLAGARQSVQQLPLVSQACSASPLSSHSHKLLLSSSNSLDNQHRKAAGSLVQVQVHHRHRHNSNPRVVYSVCLNNRKAKCSSLNSKPKQVSKQEVAREALARHT